jgi:hypothetical protein
MPMSNSTNSFFTNFFFDHLTPAQKVDYDITAQKAEVKFDAAIENIKAINRPSIELQISEAGDQSYLLQLRKERDSFYQINLLNSSIFLSNSGFLGNLAPQPPNLREERVVFELQKMTYQSPSQFNLIISLMRLKLRLIGDAKKYRLPAQEILNIANSTEELIRTLVSSPDVETRHKAINQFILETHPSCQRNRLLSAAVGAVVEAAFYFSLAALSVLCLAGISALITLSIAAVVPIPVIIPTIMLLAGPVIGVAMGIYDGLRLFDMRTYRLCKMAVAENAKDFISEANNTPQPRS